MKKEESWVMRLYFDEAWYELARAIGYAGFPARELAERVRHLTQKHGVQKVSEALNALASFEGNRVLLQREVRPKCGMLLGPPPEKQLEFWQDVKPECRPAGWDTVPVIPKGGPDPLMEGLYRLAPPDLLIRLHQACRDIRQCGSDADRIERVAVESELLRRGMELPPAETCGELLPSQLGSRSKRIKEEAPPRPPGRSTPESAAESMRGSIPQRVLNVLLAARKAIAGGGPDAADQRVWAAAAEAELRRQGVEIPAEQTTPELAPKKRTKKAKK